MPNVPQQTPRWQRPRHQRMLRFDVRLVLPIAPNDVPLQVNTLKTDLALFKHHIGDLGNTAYFDNVLLETQNTAIRVDVSSSCCHPVCSDTSLTYTK